MTTTIAQLGSAVVLTPFMVLGYEATYSTKNVGHKALGKRSSTYTVNGSGLRAGTITFLFLTEAAKTAAVQALTSAAVFQLSTTDLGSINMQFVAAGDITEKLDDETRTSWTVAVDFEEVT